MGSYDLNTQNKPFQVSFDDIRTIRDPLIVDLNNDGFAGAVNGGVYFDLDAEATLNWVGPQDGLIVLDANANNRADDGNEIFSASGANAWIQLAAYDTNSDDAITSADAVWAQLHVWQDKNSDGYTQANEWFTMDDLGITSVNIAAANGITGSVTTGAGNLRTDGVSFMTDDRNTRFNGDIEIDFTTLFLPQLGGYNALPDLRAANDNSLKWIPSRGMAAA